MNRRFLRPRGGARAGFQMLQYCRASKLDTQNSDYSQHFPQLAADCSTRKHQAAANQTRIGCRDSILILGITLAQDSIPESPHNPERCATATTGTAKKTKAEPVKMRKIDAISVELARPVQRKPASSSRRPREWRLCVSKRYVTRTKPLARRTPGRNRIRSKGRAVPLS